MDGDVQPVRYDGDLLRQLGRWAPSMDDNEREQEALFEIKDPEEDGCAWICSSARCQPLRIRAGISAATPRSGAACPP